MDDIVIVGAVRTPIGRFGGALASIDAVTLGGIAIRDAVARSGVDPSTVDRALLGHVLQAGAGQNPARQAAVAGGLGMHTPAETVNTVCLSGMTALAHGRDLLRLGAADVVVAGGMESMSQAPHLLDRSRTGYRYGHGTLVDVLIHDGLTCAFDACSMGEATERYQATLGIDRAAQDDWSARSHELAARAAADPAAMASVTPVEVTDRSGSTTVRVDEGVRPDADVAALGRLRPAFSEGGTITAGNASQLSDGAAALVLTTAERAEQDGLPVLGRIVATGMAPMAPGSIPRASTATRSTRPSPRSRSPRSGPSVSTRHASTCSGARSRSVTRSAAAVHAWSSRSSMRCGSPAVGGGSRRCAAEVGREPP